MSLFKRLLSSLDEQVNEYNYTYYIISSSTNSILIYNGDISLKEIHISWNQFKSLMTLGYIRN